MPGFELDLTQTDDLPDIKRLLQRLEPKQFRAALKVMGEAGVDLAQQAFQQSTAPDGTRWAALQESTLNAWVGDVAGRRRRRTYGKRPLVRHADLMRSVRLQFVGDDAVVVGTAQAAGVFHQGDPDHPSKGIIPPRRFLPERDRPLPDAWREELVDALEAVVTEGL